MNVSFFVGHAAARARGARPTSSPSCWSAAMALFMLWYGAKLVDATWHNTIAEFPALSVGVTYLPIPIGGAFLLLFVIERLLIGAPPDHRSRRRLH